MEDLFSVEFPPAVVAAILAFIAQIKNTMPEGLINLTPDERQFYFKMGDKSIAFVSKALEFAQLYPQLVPAYVDVNELKKDLDAVVAMQTILRSLEEQTSKLQDSILFAGHEAMSAALSIYNAAKDAARRDVPGAKVAYNEMKERFPGKKSKAVPPSA
ncbi:MAG: hypothetical protein WCH34_06945 [Bacteroidota bacterium]